VVILELIHAPKPDFVEGLCLSDTEPTQALPGIVVIHNNRTNRMASAGDESFKFLTYTFKTTAIKKHRSLKRWRWRRHAAVATQSFVCSCGHRSCDSNTGAGWGGVGGIVDQASSNKFTVSEYQAH